MIELNTISDMIKRSTRHAKITGDFAEHLTLYLLSKQGFECARVDHTGMDIIARNPITNECMGISVKSRSRTPARAASSMNVEADNFNKLANACEAFGCVPYHSFVIDRKVNGEEKISAYIMSQKTLFNLYPKAEVGHMIYWAMSPTAIEKYCSNPNIYRWELMHKIESWWS